MFCVVILTTVLFVSASNAATQMSVRNAITDSDKLWPQGKVPVVISDSVSAHDKILIFSAMKQIEFSTESKGHSCLTFIQRSNEQDYIEFKEVNNTLDVDTGRTGGKQTVTVGHDPDYRNILQRLMFSVGIHPEVQRTDRDNHLNINISSVKSSEQSIFDVSKSSSYFNLPFDWDSVVLYRPYAFSTNTDVPTIKAKYQGFAFGYNPSLSRYDAMLIQRAYQCSISSNSNPVDLLGHFVFHCHFHFDMCNFEQDQNDDFDWALHTGPTQTPGTGPLADYSSGIGSYALAEAREHHQQTARLLSPSVSAGSYCLHFKDFLYGNEFGDFNVLIRTVEGDETLYTISGDKQTSDWYYRYDGVESDREFRLVFEASIGGGDKGDMAIDEVYLYKGICINWH